MKTQVINLFGGSGIGKSTTAAGLFYFMKLRGLDCELIREFVKEWAYEGRKIGPFDQTKILGEQAHREVSQYGKNEWVVTDSPLLLSPIYEQIYNGGNSIVLTAAMRLMEKAKASGVVHHNFLLRRHKPFSTKGRYETEEQARNIDEIVQAKLNEWGYGFTVVDVADEDRAGNILGMLASEGHL